jgi:hypothetical protein
MTVEGHPDRAEHRGGGAHADEDLPRRLGERVEGRAGPGCGIGPR